MNSELIINKNSTANKKNYYIKTNAKYILCLTFLIANFITFEFASKNEEELFNKLNLTLNEDNYIVNETKLNNFETIIKNKDIVIKPSNICISTNNKIFWKNRRNLEIEKCMEEIRNSNKFKISFESKADFYKRKKPKISIIITIYNQRNFIKPSYTYIQRQELKNIEIIFIDDASTDNSSLVIQELMEKDKRIIYLKNYKNKKQFYSINIGVLNSKGEYILSVDPDDFLLNNILIKAYETVKAYNLDILQFYMLSGMSLWKNAKYQSGIICNNSNIRNIYYYGISRNLPDKLIRKQIFIKSINFMNKNLYYEDYHIHTDDTIFFGLIHFANTYGFLEQIGYYYNQDQNRKPQSKINENKITKINSDVRSLFNIMKYFILQSDNNTIEKNFIPYRFFREQVKNRMKKDVKYLNKDFKFYIEVLDLYLVCPFFSKDKKDTILKLKRKILVRKRYYKDFGNINK